MEVDPDSAVASSSTPKPNRGFRPGGALTAAPHMHQPVSDRVTQLQQRIRADKARRDEEAKKNKK